MNGMENGSAAGIGAGVVVYLAILVLLVAASWRVFTKAGKPGWACLVPIYNVIVWLQIARKPGWWILLLIFVPIVNLVLAIIVTLEVAKAFGKGTGFGIGLLLLGVVFLPILAWGDARYQYGPPPPPAAAPDPR